MKTDRQTVADYMLGEFERLKQPDVTARDFLDTAWRLLTIVADAAAEANAPASAGMTVTDANDNLMVIVRRSDYEALRFRAGYDMETSVAEELREEE